MKASLHGMTHPLNCAVGVVVCALSNRSMGLKQKRKAQGEEDTRVPDLLQLLRVQYRTNRGRKCSAVQNEKLTSMLSVVGASLRVYQVL